jgi:hypothetical protein
VRLQTSFAASQYLPIRHRLPLDSERGGGLEATHHRKADPAGRAEAAQGRAQHRKSGSTVALDSLQEQSRGIHKESEGLCPEHQKEASMILSFYLFALDSQMASSKIEHSINQSLNRKS